MVMKLAFFMLILAMESPMPDPLARREALVFSHFGFYVRNLESQASFYRDTLGFFVTDRGDLSPVQLVFLSRDPTEHHQIVLASGRPEGPGFNPINQISLRVPDLATLRLLRDRVAADPAVTELVAATHGNAISIYFRDPEGNRLEVFMDTPWYCEQPLREPIDLDQDDAAVMAQAEALARSRPRFRSRAEWQADMARLMGYER
jgi:catechol 2,3-dioxygenase